MTDQFSRTLRGTKHQMLIQSLLEKLRNRGYIKSFEFFSKNKRTGYEDLKEQFYFPFDIEFHDGEKWVIQSTTSFPRERMNGYQWNATHFKKINFYCKKALVIYPDAIVESEVKKCINYHQDIIEKNICSAIDGVVSFAEFYMMIEEKWLEGESVSRKKALQGTAFEKWLVDILTHPANWDIWNQEGDTDLGFNYPFFEKVLTKFGVISGSTLVAVTARDDIPFLPPREGKKRGGKPKTDILVEVSVQKEDGIENKEFTISSKRTSSKWVAIHQYSADMYIDVMKITEDELKEALYELQKTGAPTQISEYHQGIIATMLPNYLRTLADWAYAGIGGEGDSTQKAEYFTIYKNDSKDLEIYHKDEYISKILNEVNGQLGTPFMFTYTGDRGTNIQLKGKVI